MSQLRRRLVRVFQTRNTTREKGVPPCPGSHEPGGFCRGFSVQLYFVASHPHRKVTISCQLLHSFFSSFSLFPLPLKAHLCGTDRDLSCKCALLSHAFQPCFCARVHLRALSSNRANRRRQKTLGGSAPFHAFALPCATTASEPFTARWGWHSQQRISRVGLVGPR